MNNCKTKYCLLTNDVETTSIWHNKLSDQTGRRVFQEGMPLLLDLYRKYDIKSTFYFTGYIARLIPEIVRMILKDGHEVGCHGYSHLKEHGFDVMSYDLQLKHLIDAKKILEDISGQEIISFRAPALRTNQDTVKALLSAGYKIDSSVASQRFDAFLSFGGLKKLNWLKAPRLPYFASEDSIFKKGTSNLIEVPLSSVGFPYIGTTMRIFPGISKSVRHLLNFELKFSNKPIVFLIHPVEFIDESSKNRTIERRSEKFLSYLLQDVIRSKLKLRNLGHSAKILYEKEIQFFARNKYRMITVKEYCTEMNLLE